MQFITSKQLGDWAGGMGKKNIIRTTVKTDIFHPRKAILVEFFFKKHGKFNI